MRKRTRREFIREAILAGAGVAFSPGLMGRVLAMEPGPTVIFAEGAAATPARLVRAAVEALGGMKAFVKQGGTVLLKPNIAWDRKPEFATDTHPELVVETAKMCLEAGAARVVVLDRTCNDARRCYVDSGILPAIEALGDTRVEMPFIDERRFREVRIPNPKAITKWTFYEEALDADTFINMPIAKHHAAAILTLGLKNIMGVLGGNRGLIHRDLGTHLADLNKVIRPALVIMDATRILIRNGPETSNLDDVRHPNTVIAGIDPVAVDSVTCELFGLAPKDIPAIVKAQEEGLGTSDLARITVKRVKV